jgi:diguanylate cyclase (GGDEF)-like protein
MELLRPDAAAPSTRRAAVLAAFHLVQDVQTPHVERARVEIAARLHDAETHGWSDVATTLLYALAVDADANRPGQVGPAVDALVQRAERESDSAMLAAGLGMRAELAARSGTLSTFGPDVSRAMLLLDVPADPLAVASAMICVALAYEALNLWELGVELYTRAETLLPLCDDHILAPVTGLNRAQARFWWTAALIEVGRTDDAAAVAVAVASQDSSAQVHNLPASWEDEHLVSRLGQLVLCGKASEGDVGELTELLNRLSGTNWLARAQIHLALAHRALRDDDRQEARTQSGLSLDLCLAHGTTDQRLFALWTAQLVEQREHPMSGLAVCAYASALAEQRWEERLGRLAVAYEQVTGARLRGEHDHLVRRTLEDPLTGLGNRRALDERLDYLRATLGGTEPASMLVVDVDRFKRVNDVFGHEVGDQVLRLVAQAIAAVLRPEDLAFRFGGDEFGAVIAGAPAEVVRARAQQIGHLVEAEDWARIRPDLRVTVSVGAASSTGIDDIDALYARADQALYAAKSDGSGLLRIAL